MLFEEFTEKSLDEDDGVWIREWEYTGATNWS